MSGWGSGSNSRATARARYYGLDGDGPWELAGSPRIINPFPEDHVNANVKRIERDYAVKPEAWTKLAIGQPDATFPDAKLAYEVESRRTPAFIYFRRSFGQVPEIHYEYSSTTYTYPAYASATGGELIPDFFREEVTRTVNLRIQYKYYLTANPEADIGPHLEAAFKSKEDGYERPYVLDTTISGGKTFGPTVPSLTGYLALVAEKSWIRAEDDVFERWHGNIWRRVRKEVLAQ